ncbi:hypothetical protein [Streptomyces rectiverticillatus]|uniref:hypothetical protein n=1 Tax=Streptomyces rectiverticillatus TaxID=173860 RepID=UPI001FE9CBBC|nr:hypothetical protein [Streptomyces rectiverticillatus]
MTAVKAFPLGFPDAMLHGLAVSSRHVPVPAEQGSTPVGLISGPGGLWVVLLGTAKAGTGTPAPHVTCLDAPRLHSPVPDATLSRVSYRRPEECVS